MDLVELGLNLLVLGEEFAIVSLLGAVVVGIVLLTKNVWSDVLVSAVVGVDLETIW